MKKDQASSTKVAEPILENAEAFEASANCRNCETPLIDADFCANCGQKRAFRLDLSRVFRQGFDQIMSLDSALLRTFIGLSLRPGKICRAYISGKRIRFYNPAKYAFFMITTMLLIVTVFNLDTTGGWLQGKGEQLQKQMQIFNFILGLSGYLFFLYNFPAAALHKGLFKKGGIAFAEAYVFGLYIGAHVVIFNMILAITGLMATRPGFILIALIQLFYTVWAFTDFYENKSFRTLFKATIYYIALRIFQVISGMLALFLKRFIALMSA